MIEWYYARDGKQHGPVSFEQLVEIARGGGLDPLKDLVWHSNLTDWIPAGQIPGIFGAPAPASDPSNPYAAPDTTWTEVARTTPAGDVLPEIVPGSEPIDVGGCVKRGFDLTCRNFGMILLVIIVYMAVTFTVSTLLALIDAAMGWGQRTTTFSDGTGAAAWRYSQTGSPLNLILSQVLSIFLSLGGTRIGLNLVSGREFNIGMLFEGGKKLLPALGASILYGLMVAVGLVLLIVPGIYVALRYGFFLTAMVDRNLGVMDSFNYSASITTNNRLNLFLLSLLGILIAVAGCLALCLGLFFALPVISLSWMVAYRWMQYGHRAALDHPGTTTPMSTGL